MQIHRLAKYVDLPTRTVMLLSLSLATALHAQTAEPLMMQDNTEHFRVEGFYWHVSPSGAIYDTVPLGKLPIDSATGFDSYSAAVARADVRIAKKHHLMLEVSPHRFSQQKSLDVDVTFRNKQYTAGTQVNTSLGSYTYSPGYQYNFLQRGRGHLGVLAEVNFINLHGQIEAAAFATTPTNTYAAAYAASAGKLLILPVVGLDGAVYALPRSGRLFVNVTGKGLPFFGYGSYVAARGLLGVAVTRHLAVEGGYDLNARLIVHGKSDRLGFTLSQQGPVAGLRYIW